MPAAPANWSGPLLLFEGAAAWLPECTGELGDELFNGGTLPIQEDVRCYGCSCGELTGGGCSLPYVTYTDASCNNEDASGSLTASCNTSVQGPYVKFGNLEVTGGCAPEGGGEVSRTDPRWEKVVRGCGLSDPRSAGCEDDSICMPEPASPFGDTVCVYRSGEHACPADYPNKHSYLTTMKDERQCEPCSCVPSGDCSAILTAYDNQSCATGGANMSEIVALGAPDMCRDLDTSISVAAMRLSTVNFPGNCFPVTPPTPMKGSIRAEGPFTVCCQ